MNKTDYFKEDFKMEFDPDGTPYVYAHITESFVETLNSMYDNGSALLSNRIRMTQAGSLIEHISRNNDLVTISLNKDMTSKLKGDGTNEVISAYFTDVIGIIEKYITPENLASGKFIPLFTCGYTYIPDQALAYLIDTGISYDNYHYKYDVMMHENAYKILVVPFKNYIKTMIKKIFGARKVVFYDKQMAISILDNISNNNTIDKAIAYTMSVLFILYGLDNMLWYKNQIDNNNAQQISSQESDQDTDSMKLNIQFPNDAVENAVEVETEENSEE